MKKFICLLSVLAILIVGEQNCAAEVKSFHAESSYIMDRGEPIKDAQDAVFNDAIQKISESANVFIDSSSLSRDSELEHARIESFTAAVLRIKSKSFLKELTDDGGLKITVKVDAELDTAAAEEILNELREAKNSSRNYEEVLKDYTERKKNFDTVYGEYLGSYQKRIMRKILEGCKLQSDGKLDEALKLYDAAIEEATANGAEFSIAYAKRAFIYRSQGKEDLAMADIKKAINANNDDAFFHLIQGIVSEIEGDKTQAVQEYRAFVQDANIVFYDTEIIEILDRIVELEEVD